MKTKYASVVVVLFAFSFFFSLGFHTANADAPWGDCSTEPYPVSYHCCTVGDIAGVWRELDPQLNLWECSCQGYYPDSVVIFNPCNCTLDCGSPQ